MTMKKEKVDPVQFGPGETFVEAPFEPCENLLARGVAEHALGGNPHTIGETAIEGLADNELSFAPAVGGRDVEKVDAAFYGFEDGGNRFITASRAPDLADTTATECQRTYLAEFSKDPLFHRHNLARMVTFSNSAPIM